MRKNFFFDSTLYFLTASILSVPFATSHAHSPTLVENQDGTNTSYTMNFRNISVLEYVKFVSKITGINFIYNESDLGFTVTILSEEPVSKKNVVSALIQVLQVNGLNVSEQDNSLLITRVKDASQFGTVVNPSSSLSATNAPIITKIFRLKNVNIATIAPILQSLASKSAIIEALVESKQIIITDTYANIEKVSDLLGILDSPESPLDIVPYSVKNVASDDLASTLQKIIEPFKDNNVFITLPQSDKNLLLIISTPYLLGKATQALATIDVPNVDLPIVKGVQDVYIYKPEAKSPEDLLNSLLEVSNDLESDGSAAAPLVTMLRNAKVTADSNTLVFVGPASVWEKVQEFLMKLDTPGASSITPGFWIYHIKAANPDTLQDALLETADNIEKSKAPDPNHLVEAIDSMQYVQSTNSLVFNGSPQAIEQLQDILDKIDTTVSAVQTNIFIYKPKYVSKDVLDRSISQIVETLDPQDKDNTSLAQSLRSAQWLDDTHSFVFRGDAQTLAKVKELMQDIDTAEEAVATSGTTFHLYKLQYASGSQVEDQLKAMSEKLPDDTVQAREVVTALQDVKWIPENNSLLISGTPAVISKVIPLVEKFDVSPGTTVGSKDTFFIYNPQVKSAEIIQAALREYADTFAQAGLSDPSLISTIESSKLAPSSNQLIFTGNANTLDKVRDLLATIDVPDSQNASIHNVGDISFYVYPLKSVSPQQFMDLMRNFETNLQKNGALDSSLQRTIDSMQYIKDTNSIMFIGPVDALDKISNIAAKIDVGGSSTPVSNVTYEIYNPKYEDGEQIIDQLCEFVQNLAQSGVQDSGLFDTVDNIKWIPKNNSLIISGSPENIEKVRELIARFDNASDAFANGDTASQADFLVYKLQYHSGETIQSALKKMAHTFAANGPAPNPSLASAIESLQWIQVTNSLLVSGPPEVLERVKGLIQDVDVPVRQVFIEVLVIETDVSNNQNFGLQWGGALKYLDKVSMATGNYGGANPISGASNIPSFLSPMSGINATSTPTPSTITGPSGSNWKTPSFDLGVIGDLIMHKGQSFLSLGSLVNAIQLDNDSTVVMNPKILTQDNNTSTIFIGQNIPYTGSVVQNTQNNTLTTSNLEYRNVGTNLSITPTLGNDDIITLDITYTMSAVVQGGSSNSTLGQVNGVQTNQTNMTTKVIVPDQHFVVLSGMLQDTKSYYKSGIPCLGGIPLIGLAFSENDRSNSKSNIIIFIRPQIIHNFDEYKQITENQEDLYREQAAKRTNREDFDSGLNFVKTPENE